MSKKQEVYFHLIFWSLFIIMDQFFDLLYLTTRSAGPTDILHEISFHLIQVIIFYINYLWIFPKTIPYKKWFLLFIGIIGMIFLFPGLRFLAEEVVIFQITGEHNYTEFSRNFFYYAYDNSYYAFRIILWSLVLYFFKYLLNFNKKLDKLALEKKRAELQVLKTQLSPHFLFNTLNSFYSDLLKTDPRVSQDILKLSEMLRYITYENSSDSVLLKDEIEFIKNYIALFSRRFDDKTAIEFDFPKNPRNKRIPSLILIPFIENAFKHGIFNDKNKPLKIFLKLEPKHLYLLVENALNPSENYQEKGIGISNIKQRLELLFPENYLLEIAQDKENFRIKLKLPLI